MKRPNGYGSIIKLKGKRRRPYGVRVTIGYEDDKQVRKFIGYAVSYKEANKLLSEYNETKGIVVGTPTVSSVYNAWSAKHFLTLANSSIKSIKLVFKAIEKLHDKPIKNLKTQDLQNIIDEIPKSSTKLKAKNLLGQLYKYALKNDFVLKDYSKFIITAKIEPKLKRRVFTSEEIKTLWDNLALPYVDVVLILIYTGFRVGELLELKKTSVDLNQNIITGGFKTVAGKDRIVPISDKILPLIKKRYDESDSDFLMLTIKKKKLNYINFLSNFHQLMEQLNFNHTIHDTRHTFASMLNSLGANRVALARLIGHSSSAITEKVYTHKNIEELRNEINKL